MKFTYKRLLATGVLLASIAASSGLATAQTAEAGQAPVPPVVMSAEPAVTGVIHVLKATYISTCLPNCPIFAIPAGTPVALDAVTTINCPAKSERRARSRMMPGSNCKTRVALRITPRPWDFTLMAKTPISCMTAAEELQVDSISMQSHIKLPSQQ